MRMNRLISLIVPIAALGVVASGGPASAQFDCELVLEFYQPGMENYDICAGTGELPLFETTGQHFGLMADNDTVNLSGPSIGEIPWGPDDGETSFLDVSGLLGAANFLRPADNDTYVAGSAPPLGLQIYGEEFDQIAGGEDFGYDFALVLGSPCISDADCSAGVVDLCGKSKECGKILVATCSESADCGKKITELCSSGEGCGTDALDACAGSSECAMSVTEACSGSSECTESVGTTVKKALSSGSGPGDGKAGELARDVRVIATGVLVRRQNRLKDELQKAFDDMDKYAATGDNVRHQEAGDRFQNALTKLEKMAKGLRNVGGYEPPAGAQHFESPLAEADAQAVDSDIGSIIDQLQPMVILN